MSLKNIHENRSVYVQKYTQRPKPLLEAMVEAGVLDKVGMIFGAHLDSGFPTGTLAVTDGGVNAAADTFSIRIIGRGGHGGRPHQTIDAIVVGSHLVTTLQSVVARQIAPAEAAVLSIGRFEAGSASNAIAQTALLEGTVRSFNAPVRRQLHESLRRIVDGVTASHGATAELHIQSGPPAVHNTPVATTLARRAVTQMSGAVLTSLPPASNMGAEDFSFYLQHVPGCYIRIGGQSSASTSHPAHSSLFDFDEEAMQVGARWFTQTALLAGRHLHNQHQRKELTGLATA